MNKFKFKFNTLSYVLLAVVFVTGVLGLALNTINLINDLNYGGFKTVFNVLILLINLFLVFIVVSVFFVGHYNIVGDKLVLRFGIFKTVYKINEIISVAHFKKSDKLVLYFVDEKYTVIVISSNKYEEFILEIRKINQKIQYESRIDGEDLP